VAIANGAPAVRSAQLDGNLQAFPEPMGGANWRVRYTRAGKPLLEVDVDLPQRRIAKVWTGWQVDYPMARGYQGWFGAHVTAPYIWLPLCALFVLLFADWRRPFRLAHLDGLALIGFGVSQWFFERGQIGLSVPLVYIPLLYLVARMAWIGLGRSPAGRLRPVVGPRVLAVVLVLLCTFRIGLNVLDENNHDYVGWGKVGSTVVDVGYAGVVGADRLQHGLPLYTPSAHLDTYGPLNYVAYMPFERIWPYKGKWDSLPAAHAAAIAFDLLTIAGLLILGVRLRRGGRDWTLGLGLACAWAACPYSTYALNANTNDSLVAAGLVWALVFFGSGVFRGLVLGLATAAKFIPAALLPVVLRVGRERGIKQAALCAIAFTVVVVAVAFAFAPPEGVGLLWRHTIARQGGALSPFSVWGMWDWLRWLRAPLELLVVLAAAVLAFRRQRSVAEAAALGAALIIGVEATALHWIYFYIVWFLPLVLLALLVPANTGSEPLGERS
jgi:hypothetical protein